jgi:hypothetical protein
VKSLIREPLAHFLVFGAALFLVGTWLQDDSAPASNEIVVTPGVVEHLAAGFTRTWQRSPNADELKGLIDEHVREEVYYREALALGLDRDDQIVRRRMRQKIEFLTDSLSEGDAPSDSVLQAFMDENADAYWVEAKAAFRHVYFNYDRRGADVGTDAESFVAELAGKPANAAPVDAGDPFLMPLEVELSWASQISRMFGRDFTEQVLELEPGRWAGPITSGYGLHVVFVTEREDRRYPELAEVRDRVLSDWQRDRRDEISQAAYERLRERYTISIEWSPEEAS